MLDEATRGISDIIDDISVWYTRRSRDRLKGDAGESAQKEAYETLSYVLITLSKVMAPVMPFIAERVYKQTGGTQESVHLEHWPEGGEVDTVLLDDMKHVREAVSLGLMKRTEAKINVKQPLLSVTFKQTIPAQYFDLITDELNVKNVFIDEAQESDVILDITITEGLQREGDMRKLQRALQELRKENNLSVDQVVAVQLSAVLSEDEILDIKKTIRLSDIVFNKETQGKKVELSGGEEFVALL